MKFLFIRSSDIQSCFFGRDSEKENLPRIFLSDFSTEKFKQTNLLSIIYKIFEFSFRVFS